MDWTVLTLNNEDNNRQVKKLVLAACTGNWENDPQRLANFTLSSLLVDLMQRYPSPEQLQERLDNIVENLNKKTEYRRVARLVVEQLQPLYPPPEPTAFLNSRMGGADVAAPPTLVVADKPDSLHPKELNPLFLAADSEPTEITEPFSIAAGAAGVAAASYMAPELLQSNPSELETAAADDGQLFPPDSWFDVRWEIMKYANPLTVKILLYSAIYQPFDFSHQAWQRLQGMSLDDLLAGLLSNHCRLGDIEQKLQETATHLEQTVAFTPAALTTVVPSILQALQPLTKSSLQSSLKP